MNFRALLLLLWQGGMLFGRDGMVELVDGGQYRVVNRGMRMEGSAADLSGVVLEDTATGQTVRGGVRIDHLASDWRGEGTVDAPELENIILHLVAVCDAQIIRTFGGVATPMLTLEAQPSPTILEFIGNLSGECGCGIAGLNSAEKEQILTTLLDERVARKTKQARAILSNSRENWHERHYQWFIGALGIPRSDFEAFWAFAQDFTYSTIVNNSRKPLYLEAVLLGRLGLLEVDEPDEYTRQLIGEFEKLREVENLPAFVLSFKAYGNVRPSRSVALTLIQGLYILLAQGDFFEEITEVQTLEEAYEMLVHPITNPYWHTHSAPSVGLLATGSRIKKVTSFSADLMIINFLVPMLYVQAEQRGDESYAERATRFLSELKPEAFAVIRKWNQHGLESKSAYDSQAIVQLDKYYCRRGRCIECPLGRRLIHQHCLTTRP